MIVREARSEDALSIYEIEKEAFSTPWTYESIKLEINNNKLSRYLVVEKDKSLVAYAGIWLIINEGHITNLAVKEEYRGKGVGDLLIKSLINFAERKDLDILTLEVRKSNNIAINLYEKYKFEKTGIRNEYYRDNMEDALIMTRYNNLIGRCKDC